MTKQREHVGVINPSALQTHNPGPGQLGRTLHEAESCRWRYMDGTATLSSCGDDDDDVFLHKYWISIDCYWEPNPTLLVCCLNQLAVLGMLPARCHGSDPWRGPAAQPWLAHSRRLLIHAGLLLWWCLPSMSGTRVKSTLSSLFGSIVTYSLTIYHVCWQLFMTQTNFPSVKMRPVWLL